MSPTVVRCREMSKEAQKYERQTWLVVTVPSCCLREGCGGQEELTGTQRPWWTGHTGAQPACLLPQPYRVDVAFSSTSADY